MIDSTLNTLVQRLERLERENRGLKGAGLLVLIALLSVAVMGQSPLTGPPLIEAQAFYVRDAAGKVRVMLGADGLSILDANAAPRVRLSSSTSEGAAVAGLSVLDGAGKQRSFLGMQADTPALSLRDRDGAVIWKAP